MIGWMQKHKKYLVITIWVSTIAFIGAGMFGWGHYNFSVTGDNVAKVGKINITRQEFEQEYRKIYNIYAEALRDFDQEQAKSMGLDKKALELLINQALLKNFAMDLGIRIQDSEVIDEIAKAENFQNNEHFDEELYKRVLRENYFRPKDFEANIRSALLVQKISALLPDVITPLELASIASILALQDRIEIEIMSTQDIHPKISETELKNYWETNQKHYKNPAQYQVRTIFVNSNEQSFEQSELQEQYDQNKSLYLDENGALKSFAQAKAQVQIDLQSQKAQAQAFKEYLKLKKDENATSQEEVILSQESKYPVEIIESLTQAKLGDTLKPFAYKEGYLVLRLMSKIDESSKSFEQARKQAYDEFLNIKKTQLLQIQAANKVDVFKGKDIGYIYPSFQGDIKGLDKKEVNALIEKIFNSPKSSGFVVLDQKAVLFKIIGQDFRDTSKDKELATTIAKNLKTQFIDQTIIDQLKQKYPIQRYQQ